MGKTIDELVQDFATIHHINESQWVSWKIQPYE
jgi:hypothetical protein